MKQAIMLTFYYSIARKQSLKERKVPQDKKVPGYAMALFDSLPRNSVYFFCFCFFGYL